MSVRSLRPSSPQAWIWSVAFAGLLLGALMRIAWVNQETNTHLDPDIRYRILADKINLTDLQKMDAEITSLRKEITSLRKENTELQSSTASRNNDSKILNNSLQQMKLWGGLTEVTGPGITITLSDSKHKDLIEPDRIIHDFDVLHVVNEMWASGAEAIEVNGHRIVGGSSIRCVGPVIMIDAQPISSPVHIRVIGDVDLLMGAAELPGGVLDQIRIGDPDMVRIDKVKEHRFAGFAGSIQRKVMKAVPMKPEKSS